MGLFSYDLDNLFGSYVNPRNLVAAFSAGLMFATGWWIIIDVAALYPSQIDFPHEYHTVGVFSTLALIFVVAPKARDSGLLCTPKAVRVILLLGLVTSFTCVIAATWIMFQEYVAQERISAWPGVGLFLQNLFIFLSAITWKLGRSREDDEYVAF